MIGDKRTAHQGQIGWTCVKTVGVYGCLAWFYCERKATDSRLENKKIQEPLSSVSGPGADWGQSTLRFWCAAAGLAFACPFFKVVDPF